MQIAVTVAAAAAETVTETAAGTVSWEIGVAMMGLHGEAGLNGVATATDSTEWLVHKEEVKLHEDEDDDEDEQ